MFGSADWQRLSVAALPGFPVTTSSPPSICNAGAIKKLGDVQKSGEDSVYCGWKNADGSEFSTDPETQVLKFTFTSHGDGSSASKQPDLYYLPLSLFLGKNDNDVIRLKNGEFLHDLKIQKNVEHRDYSSFANLLTNEIADYERLQNDNKKSVLYRFVQNGPRQEPERSFIKDELNKGLTPPFGKYKQINSLIENSDAFISICVKTQDLSQVDVLIHGLFLYIYGYKNNNITWISTVRWRDNVMPLNDVRENLRHAGVEQADNEFKLFIAKKPAKSMQEVFGVPE